jgi:predicted ATP-dependent endonuclease of OLD family
MRSYVKYLGVVDKSNKIHHVEFDTGVNVITGKSSTGKSAMIELFDYCFGSSEFTIPSGIITDNTEVYFMVLAIKDSFITIGRSQTWSKKFLKFESKLPNIETLTKEYFEESYFSKDFNVELGHYLGLDINDINEDKTIIDYTGRKKGRPSVRNMVPFLLQHQNLVANKHSLFYRFDEKEKREQTIDQFKIFAGFVKQEYYTIKQSLADEQRNLKRLENQQNALIEQNEFNSKRLNGLLDEYYAITGN